MEVRGKEKLFLERECEFDTKYSVLCRYCSSEAFVAHFIRGWLFGGFGGIFVFGLVFFCLNFDPFMFGTYKINKMGKINGGVFPSQFSTVHLGFQLSGIKENSSGLFIEPERSFSFILSFTKFLLFHRSRLYLVNLDSLMSSRGKTYSSI